MSAASSRLRPSGTVGEHRLFAALYDRMTGPLEQGVLAQRRAGLLADLGGQVLDVGAGTGANLPHFRAASRVVAAEPDPAMRSRLAAKLAGAPVPAPTSSTWPPRSASRPARRCPSTPCSSGPVIRS